MARRIYFDPSALNRPFDDQGAIRVRLETEAVEHLLRAVGERTLEWISSDIVLFEVSKCPDDERRGMLNLLCQGATERVALTEDMSRRGRELRAHGLGDLDALHLAGPNAAAPRCFSQPTTSSSERPGRYSLPLPSGWKIQ